MADKFFDKKYVEYWKKRVTDTSDGTKVPDQKILDFFIEKLGIKKEDRVLDLGCGFGRLYSILSKYSLDIVGVDVNKETLKESKKFKYKKLVRGTAEETNLGNELFDKIVAWEVYDVVEQDQGLKEENRILKKGGKFLLTGKNKNYSREDKPAFIAERNAKLKSFPNHFTDVRGVIQNSIDFGFKTIVAYGFEKRGDFGNLKFFDILESKEEREFYQFLIILEKIDEPKDSNFIVCSEYSNTAKSLAKENNFKNIKKFFKWHKEKYGD